MLRKQWLKQYENTVCARDYRILEKASRILMQNVAPLEEETLWKPYRAITPSLGKNPKGNYCFPGIWNWDSAFHMVGLSRMPEIMPVS